VFVACQIFDGARLAAQQLTKIKMKRRGITNKCRSNEKRLVLLLNTAVHPKPKHPNIAISTTKQFLKIAMFYEQKIQ
jgi:uncharacterized protein YeeX (DUF496 family)